MRSLRVIAGCAAALAITAIAAGGAKANSLEHDQSLSTIHQVVGGPEDGLWDYHYVIDLNNNPTSQLSYNATAALDSYYTVYDFNGLVTADTTFSGANGATWSATYSPLGITPPSINPVPSDNAGQLNVTFLYQGQVGGATSYDPTSPVNPAVLSFDLFSSIGASSSADTFASGQDYQGTVPTGNGDNIVGADYVNHPRIGNTPEPAFYQMGGLLGMACIGGLRRRIKGLKIARTAA